jgi:hypothetical protein
VACASFLSYRHGPESDFYREQTAGTWLLIDGGSFQYYFTGCCISSWIELLCSISGPQLISQEPCVDCDWRPMGDAFSGCWPNSLYWWGSLRVLCVVLSVYEDFGRVHGILWQLYGVSRYSVEHTDFHSGQLCKARRGYERSTQAGSTSIPLALN